MTVTPLDIVICVACAVAAFVLSYGYQRLRFHVLDLEDARQLARLHDGDLDHEWLAAASSQAARGLLNPQTADELVREDVLPQETLEAARAVPYNPGIVRTARFWAPLFVVAAAMPTVREVLVPQAGGPWGALLAFCLALVSIGMADARFRIIPIPQLLILAVSGLLLPARVDLISYGAPLAFSIVGLYMAARVYEMLFARVNVFGLGDVLLMSVVFTVLLNATSLTAAFVFFCALIVCSLAVLLWSNRGRLSRAALIYSRAPLGPAITVAMLCAVPFV